MGMDSTTRRSFVKATTGAAIVGTAGCIGMRGGGGGGGNNVDGATTVTMGTASSGSSTFAMSQALQRAYYEYGDVGQITTQTTAGMRANPRLYDDGSINGYSTSTQVFNSARNNEGNFQDDQVDDLPYQGFNVSITHLTPFALEGTGIQTTDDMIGRTVWPLPSGFGTRAAVEDVLKYVGMWDQIEIVELEAGSIAGALEEGRVDVIFGYGWEDVMPGWLVEAGTRANLHAVKPVGQYRRKAKEFPSTGWDKNVEIVGFDQDVGMDAVSAFSLPTHFWFSPNIANEVIYEICKVSHERNDMIQEADRGYPDHSNAENMLTELLSDYPVHPGAVEFYKEVGVWNDSLQTVNGSANSSANSSANNSTK